MKDTIKTSRTISIHAPREGGDNTYDDIAKYGYYFNPRPPRGGRPCGLSPSA